MTRAFTPRQIAEAVAGTLRGPESGTITGVADVVEAGPQHATFVTQPRYVEKLKTSRAGLVLVPADFGATPMPAILCQRIDRAVAQLLGLFATPVATVPPGVHAQAIVASSAVLGPEAAIGPFVTIQEHARVGARSALHAGVFVGRDSVLGDDCVLWPNVVVRDGCTLGNRVVIHSNSVIGADGFGYYFEGGRHHKVPHVGGVVIEDDVEIGACCCVDRAKFGHTVVGRGTKIDNFVQIGHNCRIGAHCVMVAQAGTAGSSRVGDYSVLAARAGILDNVVVGDRATVAAIAVVARDVPAGATVSGFPAQDHRAELRERAALRRLPELVDQVRKLMAQVERLEAATHHRT
ncbi:MAG: UDP-3-O-(3-hydroxymyristoyl)glucosamine N-acyltransferase [Planctomycetes bacterium]|nr:UDP-3-O-(3-hydroxymyristoyl)glucosamine N-acyltransferase [Planctomycetota bacterium]